MSKNVYFAYFLAQLAKFSNRSRFTFLEKIIEKQGYQGLVEYLLKPLQRFTPRFQRPSDSVFPTLGEECLIYYQDKLKDTPIISTSWATHIIQFHKKKNLKKDLTREELKALSDVFLACTSTWGDTIELERHLLHQNLKNPDLTLQSSEELLLNFIKKYGYANCGEYTKLFHIWLQQHHCLNFKCSISFAQTKHYSLIGNKKILINKKPDHWHDFNLYIPPDDMQVANHIFNADGTFKDNYDGKDIVDFIIDHTRIVDGWFKADGPSQQIIAFYCNQYLKSHQYENEKTTYKFGLSMYIKNQRFCIPFGRINENHSIQSCRVSGIYPCTLSPQTSAKSR